MNTARVVRAIVADIVLNRARRQIFVIDENGDSVLWPRGSANAPPQRVQQLVDDYVRGGLADRTRHCEVVQIDDDAIAVDIAPLYGADSGRYAVVVQPFASRGAHDASGQETNRTF